VGAPPSPLVGWVAERQEKPTIWLFQQRTPGAIAEGRGSPEGADEGCWKKRDASDKLATFAAPHSARPSVSALRADPSSPTRAEGDLPKGAAAAFSAPEELHKQSPAHWQQVHPTPAQLHKKRLIYSGLL